MLLTVDEQSSDKALSKKGKGKGKRPLSQTTIREAGCPRASRHPAKRPKAGLLILSCAYTYSICFFVCTIDQCMEFFAQELSELTRNFCRSTVIGRGGYGTVYKGVLRYGSVAIKVLSQVILMNVYICSVTTYRTVNFYYRMVRMLLVVAPLCYFKQK